MGETVKDSDLHEDYRPERKTVEGTESLWRQMAELQPERSSGTGETMPYWKLDAENGRLRTELQQHAARVAVLEAMVGQMVGEALTDPGDTKWATVRQSALLALHTALTAPPSPVAAVARAAVAWHGGYVDGDGRELSNRLLDAVAALLEAQPGVWE